MQPQAEPKAEDTPVNLPEESKPPKEPVTPKLDTKNESKRGWLSWLK